MKRLLVVCCLAAISYLAIPLIVDAQSGMAVMTKGESGMPEYVGSTGGKVHVSNYSTAPDGGTVRQSADEHGRAYVRPVSADGGIPEVVLGEMLGTETNRLATTATATAGGLTGAVTVPDSVDVPVPATALENRRGVTIQNLGPSAIYCCMQQGCTAATGMRVLPSGSMYRSVGPSVGIFCISAGGDADVRVEEVR